jgi:hypothetical protein
MHVYPHTQRGRGGEGEREREREREREEKDREEVDQPGQHIERKREYMDSTALVKRETVLPINPRDPSVEWRD